MKILEAGRHNTGDAPAQVDHFVVQVGEIVQRHPDAAGYAPGSIL